ncbi:MAG: hypothetical protein ACKV2V_05770, partial [Blastocatellia bacterium]
RRVEPHAQVENFEGILTFRHCKEAIGTELTESRCEIKGQFEQRFGVVVFEFRKWLGPPPNGEYLMGIRKGRIDVANGLWSGEGFELARQGSPMVEQLLQRQTLLQQNAMAYRRRVEKDTPGQFREEQRRIEARQQEATNAARNNERTGRLSKASGNEAKCRVLVQWVNRAYQEYPNTTLDAMTVSRRFDVFVNLFRDQEFAPIFGRPYDQTTKEWRLETYQKEIQPCLQLVPRDKQFAPVLPFAPMMQGGFNYGSSGRFDPVTIFAALKERRRERQRLDQLLAQPVPTTLPSYQTIEGQIRSLAAYNPMWPGELRATREGLQTRLHNLGQQIVTQWEREAEQAPATLDGAHRLYTELIQNNQLLNVVAPAERSRIESQMERRIDTVLTAELTPFLRKLPTLPPTDEGIRAGLVWSREFETTFSRFTRPVLAQARLTGWQVRDNLFQQRLATWTAEINRLPASAQGLQSARNALTALFENHGRHRIPTTSRYEAVGGDFRLRVLNQLERLIESDRTATRMARTWYAQLLAAKPVSGEALVRGVQRVRLRFEFRQNGHEAMLSLPRGQQETIIARKLAQLGIQVDPNAAAELVFLFDVYRGEATTTRGRETPRASDVTSVWGKASLKAPVTVARVDGFHRVLATLASTVSSRIVIKDKLPPDAVEDLLQYLVHLLPLEAETRTAIPQAELEWRERLLVSLPRLNELHAGQERSSVLNAGGRKPSLASITALAPVDYGISQLNSVPLLEVSQMLTPVALAQFITGGSKFFDPSPGWSDAAQLQRWTIGGSKAAELPTPTHYLSAWSQAAHVMSGQTTTVFALMDQAALRESNCIVSLASGPARAACLTAEEVSVTHDVRMPMWLLSQQAQETVRRLFRQIPSGR